MSDTVPSADDIISEWNDLHKEYQDLEENHRRYKEKLDEMIKLQNTCISAIKHQRYRMSQLSYQMKELKKLDGDKENIEKMKAIEENMKQRNAGLRDLEEILPKPNGYYLLVILGNVNVSILNKSEKFKYKADYEKFKVVCVFITMILALTNLLTDYRVLDALLYFLLVWYYCTLTIRESILRTNGSKIRGWWVAHHYISTALSGVIITWPYSVVYQMFRDQFIVFCLWLSVVNVMQYYYQRGSLYRLRALGERHNMDITVEGFQSWMWRGLSFLLPFLFSAYMFQLYNAYTLYHYSFHPECHEWQVPVLAALFFILFSGNMLTLAAVLKSKLREKVNQTYEYLGKNKYKSN